MRYSGEAVILNWLLQWALVSLAFIGGIFMYGFRKREGDFFRPQDIRRIRMIGAHRHVGMAVTTVLAGSCTLWILWYHIAIKALSLYDCPWWSYLPLIVAGVLAIIALYLWARLRKFGVSVLELSPSPAVAGETLCAMIYVPRRLDSDVIASIRYVHRYMTGGSEEAHALHTDTVWTDIKQASVYTAGDNASQVRAEFEIPQDFTSSTRIGMMGHWWELTLKSNVKGIDYKASFEIPVRNHKQLMYAQKVQG